MCASVLDASKRRVSCEEAITAITYIPVPKIFFEKKKLASLSIRLTRLPITITYFCVPTTSRTSRLASTTSTSTVVLYMLIVKSSASTVFLDILEQHYYTTILVY